MADEKASAPKPAAKPGSLKPAGSKKGGAKDYKSLTGRQKAAIFLVSLGSDVSSEIMKHLREDEVETLTFEIARLETVDADFKDQVLEEFKLRSFKPDAIDTIARSIAVISYPLLQREG